MRRYSRQSTHLLEVLPIAHRPVAVSVLYMSPENEIHRLGFQFEREMLDMLNVRSRTPDRCTDQFGNKNIHVNLGSLQKGLSGLCLGVGQDAGNWAQTDDTLSFLSKLDQEHSMNYRERVADIGRFKPS
jgi:hypothetical protein